MRSLSAILAIAAGACGLLANAPACAAASAEPREFEGSWSAAGTRQTILLGAERKASILALRGTLLLSGPARPGVGFRSDVVALSDSATGLVGRSVWTDERGDQVFSEIKGEGTAARNRITGTIVGGTGRYAGATGSYEFSWEFVIETEDGAIQGRTVGLRGRVVPGPSNAEGSPR